MGISTPSSTKKLKGNYIGNFGQTLNSQKGAIDDLSLEKRLRYIRAKLMLESITKDFS